MLTEKVRRYTKSAKFKHDGILFFILIIFLFKTLNVYANNVANTSTDNNASLSMKAWVNNYIQWHNATLGSQTQALTRQTVEKFFTDDAIWINNEETRASSVDSFLNVYANQINSRIRRFIQTPIIEFISTSDYVILRYQLVLNLPMGPREFHQVMMYVHFTSDGKVDKIVELQRAMRCN